MKSKYLVLPIALVAIVGLSALAADAAGKVFNQLDTDQQAVIQQLKESNADRSEIHDQLEEWGIELTAKHRHAFKRGISEQLSDDQRDKLKELREDGADRETLHEQLQAWGIEIPEPPFLDQLSNDQKDKFKELRESNVDRSEIHDQLEEWGIERPGQNGQGLQKQGTRGENRNS